MPVVCEYAGKSQGAEAAIKCFAERIVSREAEMGTHFERALRRGAETNRQLAAEYWKRQKVKLLSPPDPFEER